MICINTPQKPPWNSKLTLSKFGHFQVNHLSFRGCTSFHVPGTSVKELLRGHLESLLPLRGSQRLRILFLNAWGAFFCIFLHMFIISLGKEHQQKVRFLKNMINKNSEAKKGFWKQRRNSPSKKDGHEITWTQQGNSKIWPWIYIQQRTVFISIKKVSSVFSPQFTWKGHKFQWKKHPQTIFYHLVFFLVFGFPKKFSKFPGPGGERRQRGKGGREWQGAGWIFHWMTPKVLRGSNVLLKIRSVVRKRLICMYMYVQMLLKQVSKLLRAFEKTAAHVVAPRHRPHFSTEDQPWRCLIGRPKSSCHLKVFLLKLVILLSDISSELGVSNFVCKDLGPPPFDPSGHTDQVRKGGLRSGKWRGFLRCFVGNDCRYTYAHIHKSIHVYNICICRYIYTHEWSLAGMDVNDLFV